MPPSVPEAAARLDLTPTATPEEVRARYEAAYSEYQIRIDNAPTPALRLRYQAALAEIEAARQVLLQASASRPAELPSEHPVVIVEGPAVPPAPPSGPIARGPVEVDPPPPEPVDAPDGTSSQRGALAVLLGALAILLAVLISAWVAGSRARDGNTASSPPPAAEDPVRARDTVVVRETERQPVAPDRGGPGEFAVKADSIATRMGYDPATQLTVGAGSAAQGDSVNFPMILPYGSNYLLVGFCDTGCAGLRLALWYEDESEIHRSSSGFGAGYPTLVARYIGVALYGDDSLVRGENRVMLSGRVTRCRATRCAFAVRMYRRRAP